MSKNKKYSEEVPELSATNGAQVLAAKDTPAEQPAPLEATPQPVMTIERKLGGFDIIAIMNDAPASRRAQKALAQHVDDFLHPYNEERRHMTRIDASRVCSALTLKVKSLGVTFAQPFSIKNV